MTGRGPEKTDRVPENTCRGLEKTGSGLENRGTVPDRQVKDLKRYVMGNTNR